MKTTKTTDVTEIDRLPKASIDEVSVATYGGDPEETAPAAPSPIEADGTTMPPDEVDPEKGEAAVVIQRQIGTYRRQVENLEHLAKRKAQQLCSELIPSYIAAKESIGQAAQRKALERSELAKRKGQIDALEAEIARLEARLEEAG